MLSRTSTRTSGSNQRERKIKEATAACVEIDKGVIGNGPGLSKKEKQVSMETAVTRVK